MNSFREEQPRKRILVKRGPAGNRRKAVREGKMRGSPVINELHSRGSFLLNHGCISTPLICGCWDCSLQNAWGKKFYLYLLYSSACLSSGMRARSVSQSSLTLCDPMDCSRPSSSVRGDSPGEDSGVGFHYQPRNSPVSPVPPALADGFVATELPGKLLSFF